MPLVLQRNAAAAMAMAMRTNTVTELDFSCLGLEDAHVLPLCEALTLNTSVVTIELSDNAVGEAGAVALADACERNTTVTTINLYDNPCSDDDASEGSKTAFQRIKAACAVRVTILFSFSG